jgi:hypothetical protein
VLARSLSVAVILAVLCATAEARTIYTIAGGGALPPPRLGAPAVPATAIALEDQASLSATPGGDLMIESGARRLLLDRRGMVRAVPRARGPTVLGADRSGIEYFTDGARLLLRRPGERSQAFASLQNLPSGITDWLVDPEGGVLVATESSVLRVMPNGSTIRIAGTRRPGHSEDGGPANQASLRYPTDLAWGADGNLLIADRNDNRVRRVDRQDGTISTVAGTGEAGFGGDGGEATRAPLDGPTWLTAGPHGGVAIAESFGRNRIRRVSRRGIIYTVAGGGLGGYSGRGASMSNGDGENARKGSLYWPEAPVITPSDEYIFADDDLIRFATSPKTTRLALALRTALPGRRRVSYALSAPARLRLVMRGEGRRLVRTTQAPSGLGYFRLPRGMPTGGYHVTLTATAADGVRAVREAGMITARRLSRRLAAAAIQAEDDGRPLITPVGTRDVIRRAENIVRPSRCHRFGPRHVDCVFELEPIGRNECDELHSVRLDRRGQIYIGVYNCVGFRRRPPWSQEGALRPTPMFMLGPGPFDL